VAVVLALSRKTILAMSKLERITHVCLIGVCLVSMGLLLERRFGRNPASGAKASSELTGTHVQVPGMVWGRAKLNAVVIISTTCPYCRQSTPFYLRLAAEARQNSPQSSFSVLSRQPAETVKAYLSAEHIDPHGTYQILGKTALSATPTLVLVDSGGVIRRAYVGKLAQAQEQEVLKSVRRGSI
jgi:hypothetical protein